jgi:hypothetical protein
LLGYVLVPFMSLPLLPTDYRPVSVLFFALTGSCILASRLARKRMPLDELLLFGFFIACLFQTLVLVGFSEGNYVLAGRHLVVLVLGVLSYLSLKTFFQLYGVDEALKLMGKVYALILLVGVLEVLCILHLLPWSVKALMNQMLGGRVVERVQVVTSEASWGAKVLLLGIPIYGFLWVRYTSPRYLAGLIVTIGLFCFTLSLDGFLAAGIAVVFFALFKYRTILVRPSLWVPLFLCPLVLILFFYVAYLMFPKGGQYYFSRIRTVESLSSAKIKELPENDGSVFIRVYYPLMGVWMFLDKPYGIGLGGYSQYFKEFLDRTGIDYTRFPEVMGDLQTRTGDPKSLYSKILSENGLYSGWVLLLFFLLHLYYLKQIKVDGIIPYRNLLIALFAVNLAILFQFGSYAFLPMWYTLALNSEVFQLQSTVTEL